MRRAVVPFSLILMLLNVAFATHFTGTYVDQQNGVTILIQQSQDGQLQGSLSGPNGNFQLQGQGNQDGAAGVVMSTQGQLGFQARLSPDGQVLEMDMYQMGPDNQPVMVGSLRMQRSASTAGPSMGGQPAFGGAPQMPPGGMPAQPGAGMPGMGFPGVTAPGTTQPGMAQPGVPGATQPGMTQPGMGQPGMGQPGMGQPGMGQPGMPPQTVPGTQAMGGGWYGAFVGNGGQLVMSVQPTGQGTYAGFFEVQGQRYPLQARGDAQYLEGYYTVNGGQYEFYAERYEGYVYLIETIDGTEYLLEPMNFSTQPGMQPGAQPGSQPGGPGTTPPGNPWGGQ